MAGAQAGTFFSLSALACKIGFIFGSRSGSWLAMALGAAASFALTSAGWCAKPGGSKTATASSCARAETSRRWSPRWCSGWWFWGSVYRARGLRTWLMSWTLILAGVVAISGVKVEDLPVKDFGDAARGLGGLGGSADCEDEEGTRG